MRLIVFWVVLFALVISTRAAFSKEVEPTIGQLANQANAMLVMGHVQKPVIESAPEATAAAARPSGAVPLPNSFWAGATAIGGLMLTRRAFQKSVLR